MDKRTEKAIRRVKRTAYVLDSSFRIPGTNYRFGLDGLLGLIPGADLLLLLPSLIIIYEARRAKMSKRVLIAMVGNILLDAALGLIPVAGDAVDFFFKSNQRNAELFLREIEKRKTGDKPAGEEIVDI